MKTAGIILCGGRSSRMGQPKAWLPFGDELMLQRVVRIVREAVEPVVVVAAPGQEVPPLPSEVLMIRDEVEGRGPLGGLAAGLTALEGKADAAYLSSCDVPLLKAEFVRRVVELLEEPTPPTPFPSPSLTSPLEGEVGEALRAGWGGRTSEVEEIASPPTRRVQSDAATSPSGGEVKDFSLPEGPGVGSCNLIAVPFIDGRLHPLASVYRVAVLPVVRDMLAVKNFRMTDLLSAIPSRIITDRELASTDAEFRSLRNLNTPDEYAAALRQLRAVD